MKKILVSALVLILTFLTCSCQIGIPMGSKKPSAPTCETCLNYLVGEWYYFTDEGVLNRKIFNADGTMSFNDEKGYWDCVCEHYPTPAYTTTLEGINYGDRFYDPQSDIMSPYAKNRNYTFVELTEDNWKDYFSENFDEVFDTVCEVTKIESLNEWNEVDDIYYDMIQYSVLKDKNRFAPLQHLTVEYDRTFVDLKITIDPETCEIIDKAIPEDYEYEFSPQTNTTKLFTDIKDDCSLLNFDQINYRSLQEDNSFFVSLNIAGEKIYRMKGWLVLNADN